MNTKNIVFVVCLLATTTTFASATTNCIDNIELNYSEFTGGKITINPLDVFFTDYDNQYMFIDFEAIATKLSKINIYKETELISSEDISDLSATTIYEVNFEELERNINYKIELETQDGQSIYKEFVIN